MAIKGYTAMTAAEFFTRDISPARPAWMACHFSCYSTGLTNLPKELPKGAMVIINDRTPIDRHDPAYIKEQLKALADTCQPDCFLLDFQRAGSEQTRQLAAALAKNLPCPVGISELYAEDLDCPVFVAAPPIDRPLQTHLQPWAGREIWLELATDDQCAMITENDCRIFPADSENADNLPHTDQAVHCRYRVSMEDTCARLHLQRGIPELQAMLQEAEDLGVQIAVGLYQQLGSDFFIK